ncbi:MAG: alpha/beta fold hydrolase, partial [Rubrobacter sp.]
VCGTVGIPLVLVHGWACRRADWDAVIDHLGDRRVVAVDLPWHGESAGGRESWDIGAFAEVIAELVHRERLDAPILVGHSMGGAVCVEAARQLGPSVSRVIGIDALTYLAIYPRQDDEAVRATLEPFHANFAGGVRATVEALFVDRDRPELIEAVVAEMASTPKEPGIAALEGLLRWDLDAALADFSVPVTTFAAQGLLDPAAVERYGGRMEISPVEHGGHFYLREYPRATAALLSDLDPV